LGATAVKVLRLAFVDCDDDAGLEIPNESGGNGQLGTQPVTV
jgi:hypothetical protein